MDKLIKIKQYDIRIKRPQVMLVGNGPCKMAIEDAVSWSDLIEKIRKKNAPFTGLESIEEIKDLPFPMQIVAAAGNHMDDVCEDVGNHFMLEDRYSKMCKGNIFEKLLECKMDAYLTTNYSYELEYAVTSRFLRQKERYAVFTDGTLRYNEGKKKGTPHREAKYQLHSFYRMKEDGTADIWHIHGEAKNKTSIALGHYHYGNLIKEYANAISDYKLNPKDIDYLITPLSWIDFFVYGDVFLIGFDLDLSESDLWWLLEIKNRQNRAFAQAERAKTVLYVPDKREMSCGKKALLKAYDVAVVESPYAKEKYNQYYINMEKIISGK